MDKIVNRYRLSAESRMATKQITVVSFDMDGTLVDDAFINSVWYEGIPKLYAEKTGLAIDEALEEVKQGYDEIGDKRFEWYDVKYWLRRFRLDEDWRSLLNQFRNRIRLYPDAEAALRQLQGNYDLIVISNATREFLDMVLEETALQSHFHRIFSSTSDFGEVKKTPQCYQRICNILNVKPRSLVHVGDNHEFDYLVPRKLGINAYFLNRKEKADGDHVIHKLTDLQAILTPPRKK